MKTRLNPEIIRDLALDLECGFNVYINPDTGETKTILNTDNYVGSDDEIWKQEFDEMNEKWNSYVKIEPPASYEGFSFMESFLDKISNNTFKNELLDAINRRSPFANFKELVESSEYREDWFAHKKKCYYNYLIDNLNFNDIGIGD